jgi:glycosyltransferase involved in cell wall biosynthesis
MAMVEFSIITVTKNAAATLERSILSVAKQRHRPLDYIIVDGASSDATPAIVERHADVVTRFVSEPDQGIYDAMNKGLALARGDFVYFLGADDCLIDDKVLAEVATSLDGAPCDFLYGGIEVHFVDGRVAPFMPPPPADALRFMIRGCLPHQASFASRRVFDLAGKFDPRYRIAGDYDWFLRVLTHDGLVTRRIERNIASYQMGGLSNRLRQSQAEVYAIQNALPLYRRAEWLKRRVRVFQRELVSQCRQRVAASRSGSVTLLRVIFAHIGVSLIAGFAPRAWLERRLAQLQQDVLAYRIANDAPGGAG